MATGAITFALALVIVVTAPTPLILFVATGLVGLRQPLYPIVRITVLSDIYPDRIGSALGVTMAMGDMGQTLFPPVAGTLAAAVAWQAGVSFIIPLLILAGIVLWVVLSAQTSTTSEVDTLSIKRAYYILAELRRSNLVFVAFILFLFILIWQSFTGLYPTYLVEVKGYRQRRPGYCSASSSPSESSSNHWPVQPTTGLECEVRSLSCLSDQLSVSYCYCSLRDSGHLLQLLPS